MTSLNLSTLFNEQFYLLNYPDVAAAVSSGIVSSGFQHFEFAGFQEGRNRISSFYNEQTYLAANPDVAAAVQAGNFSSGLQHFDSNGLLEGRSQISPYYNEQNYLATNADVAATVQAGGLKSGLEHFVRFGLTEGRSGASGVFFNEGNYLAENSDVVAAIASGGLNSALQHYTNFGQFENRVGTFSGSSGNDIITGFGNQTRIIGVDRTIDINGFRTYGSFGSGEIDVLNGAAGSDRFLLGVGSELPNVDPQPLYIDGGNNDYALIQNFNSSNNPDLIQLAGSPVDYGIQLVNGSINILYLGDLVGIVQGVTSINIVSESPSSGTFFLG